MSTTTTMTATATATRTATTPTSSRDNGRTLAASDPVPLLNSLDEIYSQKNLVRQGKRWDDLGKRFEKEFQRRPKFIARAPGRVNCIGDHTDSMRFGCMPAAIELDILMAVSVRVEGELGDSSQPQPQTSSIPAEKRLTFHLRNTTKRFASSTFESDVTDTESIQLRHEGEDRWTNYFKVAYKGLLPHLPSEIITSKNRPVHIDVLVDGTIPPESSLSSSAAMTVCSSIVILEAFQARSLIDRSEMAEVAIESERLVGVNAGGMDQAASIFGRRGNVLYITFEPTLKAEPRHLPQSTPPHALVIANTLVVSDKKVMGPVQYNLRVCELLMACRALCEKLGLPKDNSTRLLKPLTDVYFQRHPIRRGQSSEYSDDARKVLDTLGEEAAQLVVLRDLALELLPQQAVTREEAEKVTGYSGDAFDKEFLSKYPVRAETFELRKRVQHVFDESLLVLRFKATCEQHKCAHEAYAELGRLMHESQQTLFNNYQNGCPELEEMCALIEANGAVGARPTGAGWGGSAVALVPQQKVEDVVEAIRSQYYQKRFPNLTDEEFADAVLVTQPARGACIYKV